MRKTVLASGLAAGLATAIAVPGTALAEQGVYVGLSGGLNFLDNSDFDVLGGAANVVNSYDTGYVVSGSAGYDFGDLWKYGGARAEVELSYRENDIDTHRVALLGGSQPGSTGDVNTFAVMLNAMHDFNTGTPFSPYVGAGVGYAWSELNDFGIQAIPNVLDDDDSDFAWQLIAGIGYDLTDNATLAVDYRYFRTGADITTSAATGSTSGDVDLESHSVMLGLRYRF